MNTIVDLQAVLRQFFPEAREVNFINIDIGHIHDTYKVEYKSGFILQKINRFVFGDIPSMMSNIDLITRLLLNNKESYSLAVPVLQASTAGVPYFLDETGEYWRLYTYIPESFSYDKPLNSQLAREGGRALGMFTKNVADVEVGNFIEILPNFHDINLRWENYQMALVHAPQNRFKEAGGDLHTVEKYYPGMLSFYTDLNNSDIPKRITHNDTKFNNFLFNSDGKVLSLIDLDTIMPGYTVYDFGDAIRTVGNSAEEDERDTCNIRFNYKHYQAFTQGFLTEAAEILTSAEISLLGYAPLYITYLQGLRFLTDHLKGDLYYPARYFGHNLVRASAQFTLMKQMEDKMQIIEDCIKTSLNNIV